MKTKFRANLTNSVCRIMNCTLLAAVLLTNVALTSNCVAQDEKATPRWWRGNLHTHSLWSDGNDFPEMITKWYVDNDYHFLALTDHNILSQGERWMDLSAIEKRSGDEAVKKCQAAFGDDWIQMRDKPKKASGDKEASETVKQVRLRPVSEFREKFEAKNKFLLIEAEEISDRAQGVPIHMNATNLQSVIAPVSGETVEEAINNNLRAVQEQAEKNGEPILVHLNHPNFGWAVTAENLAAVTNERFFEVYNGHPGVNHLGDKTRPGVEKIWDIVNTIRIDELKSAPIFGLATDDSHHYHGRINAPKSANTGRGWVMVKADNLDAKSLIDAMNAGEFYCSSGVELEDVSYAGNQLSLKIKPTVGITYTTTFIGTRKDYDKKSVPQLDASGKPMRATRVYSKDVGAVLATSDSLEPSYKLNGDELFVRAVVTSSKPHVDPSFKDQVEQAWTQPVGF
ncbi:MAG: hypothetical protein AB8B55_09625 [Mariniblastus sp.]